MEMKQKSYWVGLRPIGWDGNTQDHTERPYDLIQHQFPCGTVRDYKAYDKDVATAVPNQDRSTVTITLTEEGELRHGRWVALWTPVVKYTGLPAYQTPAGMCWVEALVVGRLATNVKKLQTHLMSLGVPSVEASTLAQGYLRAIQELEIMNPDHWDQMFHARKNLVYRVAEWMSAT